MPSPCRPDGTASAPSGAPASVRSPGRRRELRLRAGRPAQAERRGAAQARVLEGLITGIGFVGGGAILNQEGCGSGTATAARLWATGTLGGAVGYGLRQRGAHRRRDLCTLRWTRVFKTHKDSAGPVLDGNVE
jgi:hypothetical protein